MSTLSLAATLVSPNNFASIIKYANAHQFHIFAKRDYLTLKKVRIAQYVKSDLMAISDKGIQVLTGLLNGEPNNVSDILFGFFGITPDQNELVGSINNVLHHH